MIGKLKGLIDSVGDGWLIVDIGGVGYLVTCSQQTLAAVGDVGDPVSLAIETYVREDQIRLFGFAHDAERDWFRLLLTVQGVGTRMALGVLGALKPDVLAHAIATGDKKALVQVSGVGPKLAGRILSELKDKVPVFSPTTGSDASGWTSGGDPARGGPHDDAISALLHLGYAQPQAAGAVAAAQRRLDDGAGVEQLIRQSLKELAR